MCFELGMKSVIISEITPTQPIKIYGLTCPISTNGVLSMVLYAAVNLYYYHTTSTHYLLVLGHGLWLALEDLGESQ